MRCYEHTFIARQDLSPQQAQALAETYAGVVTEQGGEVTKSEYWGLRNLAYRIRKNRKGHYLHLNLRASAAAIDELERQERLSDDVIRYLTVRVEELDELALDRHAGAILARGPLPPLARRRSAPLARRRSAARPRRWRRPALPGWRARPAIGRGHRRERGRGAGRRRRRRPADDAE